MPSMRMAVRSVWYAGESAVAGQNRKQELVGHYKMVPCPLEFAPGNEKKTVLMIIIYVYIHTTCMRITSSL